jgi:hypothetical protein
MYYTLTEWAKNEKKNEYATCFFSYIIKPLVKQDSSKNMYVVRVTFDTILNITFFFHAFYNKKNSASS